MKTKNNMILIRFLCLFMMACMITSAISAEDQTCQTCGGNWSISEGEVVSKDPNADKITIEKTAAPQIVKGDVLTVTIYVTNGFSDNVKVDLKEVFAAADPVDMGGLKRNTQEKIPKTPVYYQTTLIVPAKSKVSLVYKIKPLYYGEFKIPATEATTPLGKMSSNRFSVMVSCNQNGVCEKELDENALVCPEDCSPKQKDELCDSRRNGACDPDCLKGEDLDCVVTTTTSVVVSTTVNKPSDVCGDGICRGDENPVNCLQDCPSGLRDGFCDGLKDGVCDPDCTGSKDPDCSKPNDNALIITLLFILVLIIVVVAYKKQWLGSGK